MENNNSSTSGAQPDETISRRLMAGMDSDLSNISKEAEDVLASLDGALFQDGSASILTSIGKPKATAAMPKEERIQILQEAQELFPQQEIVMPVIAQEKPAAEEENTDAPDVLADVLTAEPYINDADTGEILLDKVPPMENTVPDTDDYMDENEEEVPRQLIFSSFGAANGLQRVFLGALAVVCLVGFANLSIRRVKESRLLSSDTMFGVSVEGVSLEDKTLEEAADAIEAIRAQKNTSQKLTLRAGAHSYSTTLDAFSPVYDTDGALELAWSVGHTGSRSTRLLDIYRSRVVTQDMTIPCSFDEDAVSDYVAQLADRIDCRVQDASLIFEPVAMRNSDYPFREVQEVTGQTLDQAAAVRSIRDCATSGDRVIDLAITTTEPSVYLDDLKENVQPLRTFTTEYARIANRTYNIHRATDALNGTVLQPGDEFSFNRIVGNTSLAENGYREAGVIVGGRSSTDRGGGVCQAATTLYNVAVRCDMQITARDPHAIASSYVPRGQDATIAYGFCDLAFINTSDYPVYIIGTYTDTSVTFTMYGRPLENGMTIEMESEHLGTRSPAAAKITVDPTKPVGYEQTVVSALYGYDIRVYKVWYDADGNEIRRIVDHTDAYPTRRAEITVGGMAVATPAPAPAPDTGGESGGSTPDPTPVPAPGTGEGVE